MKNQILSDKISDIEAIIIETASDLNISKSEVLAQVIKSYLLSDDENPNHINGIELFQRCNKCLAETDEDDNSADLNSHLC